MRVLHIKTGDDHYSAHCSRQYGELTDHMVLGGTANHYSITTAISLVLY